MKPDEMTIYLVRDGAGWRLSGALLEHDDGKFTTTESATDAAALEAMRSVLDASVRETPRAKEAGRAVMVTTRGPDDELDHIAALRPLVATLPDATMIALPTGTVLRCPHDPDGLLQRLGGWGERGALTREEELIAAGLVLIVGENGAPQKVASIATLPDGSTVALPAGTVLREEIIADGVPLAWGRHIDTLTVARALLQQARLWVTDESPPAHDSATRLRGEIDAFLAGLPVTSGGLTSDECATFRRYLESIARDNPLEANRKGARLVLAGLPVAAETLQRVEGVDIFELLADVPAPSTGPTVSPREALKSAAERFMRDAFTRGVKPHDAAKEIGAILGEAIDSIMPTGAAKIGHGASPDRRLVCGDCGAVGSTAGYPKLDGEGFIVDAYACGSCAEKPGHPAARGFSAEFDRLLAQGAKPRPR